MSEFKYKNVLGETQKEQWTNVDLSTTATEGRLLAANPKYIAASWNTTNGGVAILNPKEHCSVKSDTPLIKGFRGQIIDLEFSPFHYDILATSSEDCSIKLFKIPENGLTKTITQELQILKGHLKKIPFMNFNPNVSDCLLSSSFDNTIKIWDLNKAKEFISIELPATPSSTFWNENGSLIASCTKNKTLNIFDPRTNKKILTTTCHDSIKSSKLVWINNENLITCGFTKTKAREFKIWDVRNGENCKPISVNTIDHSSALATPYLDKESKLLYIMGKGESTVRIFNLNNDKVYKCIDFTSKEPSTVNAMYDRRVVDYNKCEIDKFIRFSNKCLYTVSFKIPKKIDYFDPSLYPEINSGEPALNFDQWANGENKEPIKKKINEISNDFVSGGNDFNNNATNGNNTEGNNANNNNDDKIKILEEKIAELEKKLAESEENAKKLKEENENLKKELAAKNEAQPQAD